MLIHVEEVIYSETDLANEIFFILQGEVELLVKINRKHVSFTKIGTDYYFGEVDLLFSESGTYTNMAKSTSLCELLILSKEHLEDACMTFEEITSDIIDDAAIRKCRMDESKD
jgi:CRP-like cAMP-binding protein